MSAAALYDAAGADTPVRAQCDLLNPLAMREPGSDTTSAIAGEFGLAAIGIEKPQEEITRPAAGAVKELNAVATDAGVARAEPARELCVKAAGHSLLDYEKVVAARVCFDKWNQ
jgi:hypothetical protein